VLFDVMHPLEHTGRRQSNRMLLFYRHNMKDNVKGLRPRLTSESPFCPLPVQDLLEDEHLQVWTSVQSSQQEILALDVGEYQ